MLNNLISKYCNDVTIHKGTVTHEEILGNCLEGLVFKLTHSNGTVSTKKYKFPNYTIRTMLFREQFKNFAFTSTLRSSIRYFIDGWCVSQEGRDYWYQFALYAFMKYLDFKSTEPDVGSHIQLVESLSGFNTKSDMDEIFNKKMESLLAGTVVLCIGPIGSGKTTLMKKMCQLNDKLVPIDGDELDLGSDVVSKLGKERNDYTRWKIIQTLMKGNVPVVSTGGGVLFSMDRKQIFMLRNQIFETLGINIRLIVMVTDRCDNIIQVNNEYDASAIYKDGTIVFETIVTRVGRNEWTVPDKFYGKKKNSTNMDATHKFADFIKSKSAKNLGFAEKIIMEGDCVFTFPLVTPDNYDSYQTLDFSQVIDNIIYSDNQLSGTFSQVRLLTFVDGASGHITNEYDTNSEIIFSLGIAEKLQKFYGDNSSGHFYTLASKTKGQKDLSFVVPTTSIHSDGTTHITVNPGNHYPKDMKTATKMIKNNEPIVLKTKNGDDVEYVVKDKKNCDIKFYGAFAI
jgi:shikimate kinase